MIEMKKRHASNWLERGIFHETRVQSCKPSKNLKYERVLCFVLFCFVFFFHVNYQQVKTRFLAQFGVNKHLKIFQATNCTHPTSSRNFAVFEKFTRAN